MIYLFTILASGIFYLKAANIYSYKVAKKRILERQNWDLNISCGKTDGGGINADIIQLSNVPNFILIKDIYKLPFEDKQFKTVLCSHTMEHVDKPELFFNELQRVGKSVILILPPLYDLAAVFNIIEHKWIFLSFRKKHNKLPRYIKLPLSRLVQSNFGQKIHA